MQVAVPQAILLNSHGFYGDCDLLAGSNTGIPPKCNVTAQWVPPGRSKILPYASGNNPGQPLNAVHFHIAGHAPFCSNMLDTLVSYGSLLQRSISGEG